MKNKWLLFMIFLFWCVGCSGLAVPETLSSPTSSDSLASSTATPTTNSAFSSIVTLDATLGEYWTWNRECFQQFDWAPESNSLVFQNSHNIVVANPPNFLPQTIYSNDSSDVIYQPRWNIGGTHIVFVREAEFYETLGMLDLTADEPRYYDFEDQRDQVTGKKLGILSWLDQNTFAVVAFSGTDEANKLLMVSKDSGQFTILPGIGNYYLSPDREKYATKRLFYDELRWYSFPPNDEPSPSLIGSAGINTRWFEDWASDGVELLYVEWEEDKFIFDQSANPRLFIWNTNETQPEYLLPDVFGATWSPDDTRVAFYLLGTPQFGSNGTLDGSSFSSTNEVALHFGILDLGTREILTLQPAYQNLPNQELELGQWLQTHKPVWSPNGQYVIYWGVNGDLWLWERAENSTQPLTHNLEAIQASWSFDGCYLAIGAPEQIDIISFCMED